MASYASSLVRCVETSAITSWDAPAMIDNRIGFIPRNISVSQE